MRFTRVRRRAREGYFSALSYYYSRRCQIVGARFLVKGLCQIRNAGTIEISEACMLDSTWASPIKISVRSDARLVIGSHVYINRGTSIDCAIDIEIREDSLVGPEVMIMDEDGHPMNWRARHEYRPRVKADRLGAPVLLERGVWIGARATVLKGVTIGEYSVIGTGSVVTRSIPPRSFAAGVPARVIHELPE
jgi:acetyltransferase-like isoleucine patch superfamily enzyme